MFSGIGFKNRRLATAWLRASLVASCLFSSFLFCYAGNINGNYSWENFKIDCDADRECSWENFRDERQKSKLKLEPKIYIGFDDATTYEETDFKLRMYLYGAYKHSNLEGPNSADVIVWLLKYADQLDRGRAPNFASVVADINSRVQNMSTEEQCKVLPAIITFPAAILHSDRELHVIPLVYTALNLCTKPGISVDKVIPSKLIEIEQNFCGDWSEVTPDTRRNKCVLDVTKKSVELFEKLDPRSQQAVIAHTRLARVYEKEGQRENEAAEYLKVLRLNSEGVKGETAPYHVLRGLMELLIHEQKYSELSSAFKKYSHFISTGPEAFQCSSLVQDLIKAGAFDAAIPVASYLFSKFDFEEPAPPAPVGPKVFQMLGCQLAPRHYSQPSWHLSGWLRLMCDAGSKSYAQVLYNQCISAAVKSKKQGTKEFQLSVDCATSYFLKKQ